MVENVRNLIKSYYEWLTKKVDVIDLEGSDWILVGTPFENFLGDLIDLYIRIEGNEIIISDRGETLSNLEFAGVEISRSKKRKEIFESILLSHGVMSDGESIFVRATERDFVKRKHQLIQAILQINDMFFLSREHITSIFKEDVRKFLEEDLKIPVAQDIILRGKSGLEFNVDFFITTREAEKMIKASNSVNKSIVATFLFAWEDVKEIRAKKKPLEAIMIINDTNRDVSEDYLNALKQKGANYILWSKRYEEVKKLIA
ncbi:Domain of unknown function DUF1828 [Thermovibrio ammonificans HB-1]|uniref:DUF1828 domain-containing protein n=1 Tax=Thermovibrio ammonificans (strain DSM 15698 / JCM 12110 / HB-1) TaxID=648996 RepID=E8T2R3_THEA1|nr:DUF1828 domain-containing protein [Thermovibrio ammonificans]ADU95988.1 Domain of unknown function DUF1828 [Thermovibrio ammonificans HB-1]